MSRWVATTVPYRYQLYGLTLESELEFTELLRAEDGAPPDFFLRCGRTPASLARARQQGVCYQARPGEMLLWLGGVARFLITEGREIVVEAEPGASEADLRQFVLSSPLAALLLQRGLLPLHASAVATQKGALVFLSDGCNGKSTLAAEFRRRGFSILADDITAFDFPAGRAPSVMPSYPLLKLWPDSLAAVGEEAEQLPRARPNLDRRILSCRECFERRPMPLAAIYLLERGEVAPGGAPISRIDGAQRVATVMDLVYRTAFAMGLGVERHVFSQVATLVQSSRLMRVVTPANQFLLSLLAERVIGDIEL